MAKSLVAEINEVLDDFYQVVRDEFEGAAKDVADEAVQQLKAVQLALSESQVQRHLILLMEYSHLSQKNT